MKKVNLLLLLSVLTLGLISTSCSKEEDETGIEITLSQESVADGDEVTIGDDIIIWPTVTSLDVELAKFTIRVDGVDKKVIEDIGVNVWSKNITFETAGLTAGELQFVLIAEDKDGNESDPYKFSVTLVGEGTAASEKSGMVYHILGKSKGAWDLDNDVAVGSSEAASIKSVVNTDAAGSFTGAFNSQNSTMFKKDNSFDYDNATVESIAAAAADAADADVAAPAVGDIYLAKKGESFYAIKITENDASNADHGGNATNNGVLKFTYKK